MILMYYPKHFGPVSPYDVEGYCDRYSEYEIELNYTPEHFAEAQADYSMDNDDPDEIAVHSRWQIIRRR